MTSTLKDVKEKIQEHLEAATLPSVTSSMFEQVVLEYPLNKPQKYPYALVMLEGGGYDSDINHILDLTVTCYIWVFAEKEEDIRELLQVIQKLWMDTTLFAELSAVGVINIFPVSPDLPDGMMGVRGNEYAGVLSFEMIVRYDYA